MDVDIRKDIEAREAAVLSSHACLSSKSRGRLKGEEPCRVRTCFQHDRDRILHSKAFRRLKHKTQVFLSPEEDHYRTRLTHTLEVSQIARTVARALALNEDLTEAISLGHDLGHTPFGHAGERVLDELVPGGFRHVQQSLRVVEVLEKDGLGLNLTVEVRDGILAHSKGQGPLVPSDPGKIASTLEGQIVRLADIIAYVNHDLDDALRAGLIDTGSLPDHLVRLLGETHARRINTMVVDIVCQSRKTGAGRILMTDEVAAAIVELRDWLHRHVYHAPSVDEEFEKASHVLRELFVHFVENPDQLQAMGGRVGAGEAIEVSVADFVAGMTDRYALNLYHRLFLPKPWKTL